MSSSDRVSDWLAHPEFSSQEKLETILESDSGPKEMFEGNPPKPPQFAQGQYVFASSMPINATEDCIAQGIIKPTSTTAEKPVAGAMIPGTIMPSHVRFYITDVKPSKDDSHEHVYVIRPCGLAHWEVPESMLLTAPFKAGDQVVNKPDKAAEIRVGKKTKRVAEIKLVRETFLVWEAVPKPADDGDDEVVMKPKVMLRLENKFMTESVVEAEKFRLADPVTDGAYFPHPFTPYQ